MNVEIVMTFNEILEVFIYDRAKNTHSKRKKSNKKNLTKRVDKILNPPLALPAFEIEDDSDDIQGGGMEIIIPTNNIEVHTG